MDVRHFFGGMSSGELAASAYLATLLDGSEFFRHEFLKLVEVDPPLSASDHWQVRVEDGRPLGGRSIDVSLEIPSTYILVECKIQSGSKTPDQLPDYYASVVEKWGGAKSHIIAVYLAPTLTLGADEVAQVVDSDDFRRRGSDVVRAMAWDEDIWPIVRQLPTDDWFAYTGMAAIQGMIEARKRGLPADDQRSVLRGICRSVEEGLAKVFGPVRLAHWPSADLETVYTVKAPVTMLLEVFFEIEPDPSFKLIHVVEEDRVNLRTLTGSIALSPSGRKSRIHLEAWQRLLEAAPVEFGDARFVVHDRKKLVCDEPGWTGTRAELESRLLHIGTSIHSLLAEYSLLTPPQP